MRDNYSFKTYLLASAFALVMPLGFSGNVNAQEESQNIWGDERPYRSYGPSSSPLNQEDPYSVAQPSQSEPSAQTDGQGASLYPSIANPTGGQIEQTQTSTSAQELAQEPEETPSNEQRSGSVESAPSTWNVQDQPTGQVNEEYLLEGEIESTEPERPEPDGLIIRGRGQAGRDGHTIVVDNQVIRLDKIHAPHWDAICATDGRFSWRCGKRAHLKLSQLLDGGSVSCVGREWTENALIATCRRVDGIDIAASMVRNGFALVNRDNFDAYMEESHYAQNSKLGLWSGTFDLPWIK